MPVRTQVVRTWKAVGSAKASASSLGREKIGMGRPMLATGGVVGGSIVVKIRGGLAFGIVHVSTREEALRSLLDRSVESGSLWCRRYVGL